MTSVDPVYVGMQAGERTSPWPHSSTDPTATKTIRNRFSAEAYRRFRALKGAIREAIIDRRVLGDLEPGPGEARGPLAFEEDSTSFSGFQGINITPPDRGAFDFPSDERKIRAFMAWIEEQVERGILEPGEATRAVGASAHWMNTYIRPAYAKGVNHADAALVDAGVIPRVQVLENVFRQPQHADSAGLIFTRSYNELEGVTSAMDQQISRELAEGISQGYNPNKTARNINDRVDKVGIHRARTIARTETIRAHNEAALNRYQEAGIEGVQALVEFQTAGDRQVCSECSSLEGMVISVEDARGTIPVHPNCRCTWLPVPQF